MEKTTAATKAIEARISNEVWDRQKQWELRKDAVRETVAALLKVDDALLLYSTALNAERTSPKPKSFFEAKSDIVDEMYAAYDDFATKRAMSVLVCGKDFNAVSYEAMQLYRDAKEEISKNGRSYSDLKLALARAISRVMAKVREELGSNRKTHRMKARLSRPMTRHNSAHRARGLTTR